VTLDQFIKSLKGEVEWHRAEARFAEGHDRDILMAAMSAYRKALSDAEAVRRYQDGAS